MSELLIAAVFPLDRAIDLLHSLWVLGRGGVHAQNRHDQANLVRLVDVRAGGLVHVHQQEAHVVDMERRLSFARSRVPSPSLARSRVPSASLARSRGNQAAQSITHLRHFKIAIAAQVADRQKRRRLKARHGAQCSSSRRRTKLFGPQLLLCNADTVLSIHLGE